MKIAGLKTVTEKLTKMMEKVSDRIDNNNHRCGTAAGDKLDDRLNEVWMILDTARNNLNEISDI